MSYFAATSMNVTAVSTGTVIARRLLMVTVNTGTSSSVLKVYDGSDATGTLIGTIDCSTKGTLTYIRRLATGNLYIAMSGANADVTVVYD